MFQIDPFAVLGAMLGWRGGANMAKFMVNV